MIHIIRKNHGLCCCCCACQGSSEILYFYSIGTNNRQDVTPGFLNEIVQVTKHDFEVRKRKDIAFASDGENTIVAGRDRVSIDVQSSDKIQIHIYNSRWEEDFVHSSISSILYAACQYFTISFEFSFLFLHSLSLTYAFGLLRGLSQVGGFTIVRLGSLYFDASLCRDLIVNTNFELVSRARTRRVSNHWTNASSK